MRTLQQMCSSYFNGLMNVYLMLRPGCLLFHQPDCNNVKGCVNSVTGDKFRYLHTVECCTLTHETEYVNFCKAENKDKKGTKNPLNYQILLYCCFVLCTQIHLTIKEKLTSELTPHNMPFKESTTVTHTFLCDTLMEDTKMSLQEFSLDQNANKIREMGVKEWNNKQGQGQTNTTERGNLLEISSHAK